MTRVAASPSLAGLFITVLPLVAASAAQAQVHDTDIVLRTSANKLETGWTNTCTQSLEFPYRIYTSTFADFDTVNEPGIDSLPGSFTPGSRIGFDILAALRIWTGTEFVPATAADPRIRISLGGPANSRLTPLTDEIVPGFGFTVPPSGEYHFHFNYTLLSQASPPADPAEPGIYLLQLRLWSTDPAIAPSDPYYILFAQSTSDAALDAAATALSQQTGLTYGCSQLPACLADVSRDGVVDGTDFVTFINSFAIGDATIDPAADITGDSIIDGSDFVSFINAFALGC